MTVRNKLKEIRMKEHMMNKTEFAKFLKIHYKQYIKYEKDTLPAMETALNIAYKLKKDVKDIWYLE